MGCVGYSQETTERKKNILHYRGFSLVSLQINTKFFFLRWKISTLMEVVCFTTNPHSSTGNKGSVNCVMIEKKMMSIISYILHTHKKSTTDTEKPSSKPSTEGLSNLDVVHCFIFVMVIYGNILLFLFKFLIHFFANELVCNTKWHRCRAWFTIKP